MPNRNQQSTAHCRRRCGCMYTAAAGCACDEHAGAFGVCRRLWLARDVDRPPGPLTPIIPLRRLQQVPPSVLRLVAVRKVGAVRTRRAQLVGIAQL